jgi:hypothetical protein
VPESAKNPWTPQSVPLVGIIPPDVTDRLAASGVSAGGGIKGSANTASNVAVLYTAWAERDASEAKMADDETDLKIRVASLETENKIARLEGVLNTALATITGKLDGLSAQVSEQRRDRNVIVVAVIASAIALGGLIVGAVTYGDAIFGRGMNVRDVVQAVVKEQQQLHAPVPGNPEITVPR